VALFVPAHRLGRATYRVDRLPGAGPGQALPEPSCSVWPLAAPELQAALANKTMASAAYRFPRHVLHGNLRANCIVLDPLTPHPCHDYSERATGAPTGGRIFLYFSIG